MEDPKPRRWWSRKGRSFTTLAELDAALPAQPITYRVADPGFPLTEINAVDGIWSTQPSVRKVVDFIATNLASVPMLAYDRVSDDDRQRLPGSHPLASIMKNPAADKITRFRFWYFILVDWLLYDRWAARKVELSAGLKLQRIPARRMVLPVDSLDRITAVRVWGANGQTKDEDPEGYVYDAGYCDPYGVRGRMSQPGTAGTSPMQTIIQVLAEQSEAVAYRRGVWKNGGRFPAVVERPVTAPDWSDTALGRFRESMNEYKRGGGREGGIPVLEDGMTIKEVKAFSPQDAQEIEGRKLSDAEVASFFHIAPELVGARQGNYANMDAFRQGLYRESLGAYFTQLEEIVNLHLTPDLAAGRDLYVECNVESKLRGSFQEQAQVLQTATGAPWMLRSEARGRMNMPKVEGFDQPIVPLNVLTGGQASPSDSGSQNVGKGAKSGRASWKSRPGQPYETKAFQILAAFYKRQGAAVLSRLGAKSKEGRKAADYFDTERWDRELHAALYPFGASVATVAGKSALSSLSLDPDTYDEDRTLAYLTKMSATTASKMNATTLAQLEAAIEEGDDPEEAAAAVFDKAATSRAELAAIGLVSLFGNWGTLEGARQSGAPTKTWATGPNPRPEHAAMDGETVPIDESFSNGSMWPGDGADAEFGCNCDLIINVP